MKKEAIILAAGMGTRLKPLTEQTHKCLTEVNGVPILDNALSIFDELGFDAVTIVVGYLKDQVKAHVRKYSGHMTIKFVDNDHFGKTNTSYSLFLALEQLRGASYDEVYILEGDVFFERSILQGAVKSAYQNITVLEKYHQGLEGTFAELNENGYVKDWIHKSQQPEDFYFEDKYKTVNIHKFSREYIEEIFWKYIFENVHGLNKGNDPFEIAMKKLVKEHPDEIKGFVLNGQKWFEIDTVEDLQFAEALFSC